MIAEIWPTVILFLSLQTQWRLVAGFGSASYCGLDYGAAAVLMQHDPACQGANWSDLRIMEAEALPILNAGDD